MKLIRIEPSDNVAVALAPVQAGETLDVGGISITAAESVPQGHKIALQNIPAGAPVIKYGCPIALARQAIPAGTWVHTHNAGTALTENSGCVYHHEAFRLPSVPARTFQGYRRSDHRAGVRNEIWVLPTVGCVNPIAEELVRRNQDLVRGSIDGLYAFTHPYGCSQLGDDLAQTEKLLAALAHHPNAGGVLILSLGCENLTRARFVKALGCFDEERIRFLSCQDVEDEFEAGAKILQELAATAAEQQRETISASELIVGMKCGGSDGLSGITANPAVGRFSDLLVALGGSTILTEVPEMFGAESILFPRCENETVFRKAVKMTDDFKQYFVSHGQTVYENPSPGNKAGGITTLEDKSCGCVQKGGSAQITDVLGYAEPVIKNGLNLLSGPGNDLVSTTDLVAAGAQLIVFTTGRGTPFGAPVPTVKISTNTELYKKKNEWIDFNAGSIAEGKETCEEAAGRLLDFTLDIADGRKTKNELNGYRGIAIFKDGITL
ncbi:MAG: altronate dehydratase family protein [Lachnospiraceae bacterium]|nr:altronate dehydratase family protein [Lachnospiraceae bacterium]